MATKWKVFKKRARGSKYDYYRTKSCIIVAGGQTPTIILTPATYQLLKRPERLLCIIGSDSKIGFRGVDKGDPNYLDAYSITNADKISSNVNGYVNAKAFIEEVGLRQNTVCEDIYLDGDFLVADIDDFKPMRYRTV